MPCKICNDTGTTGWRKPMRGLDGAIRMIFVPQICQCEVGTTKAQQYEQNLKDGKAGMAGIYPVNADKRNAL